MVPNLIFIEKETNMKRIILIASLMLSLMIVLGACEFEEEEHEGREFRERRAQQTQVEQNLGTQVQDVSYTQ